MKREFLENLKIGETPLTKEIVDAIMDENGRDIEAAKKPFADYEAVKEQLQAAKDGLKAFAGVDVGQLQGEVAKLRGELAEKDQAWQAKLDAAAFEGRVKDAITAARGRNPKAVAALLDLDALKASKNQDADLKAALEALRQESSYLFEDAATPPPYAAGTGSTPPPAGTNPFAFHFNNMRPGGDPAGK